MGNKGFFKSNFEDFPSNESVIAWIRIRIKMIGTDPPHCWQERCCGGVLFAGVRSDVLVICVFFVLAQHMPKCGFNGDGLSLH